MDFYRLKQPGSEWFARQGDVIKAAKAAGVEWEKVEVPDSKPDRLVWLNANARDGAVTVASPASEPEEAPVHHSHGGKETACPKCKFTPRQAESYVAIVKRGLTIDAMKQWLEEREGWELSTLVETITSRLSDLVQIATGKKQAA